MVEKTITQEIVYNGSIFKVKKHHIVMENGQESIRDIVEHNGAVAILVVENNKILFVKQYRKAYEEYVLEIPAGKLELNEAPEDCARRELEEETGIKAKDFDLLQVLYPSPGFCTEKIYLFMANQLSEGVKNFDEDEFLEAEWIEIDKVREMIRNQKLHDAKTILAITLWLSDLTK